MKLASTVLLLLGATACATDPEPASSADSEASAAIAARAFSVPVYFNHTYGVISQATIDALQTNAYVNSQLVDVEVRTTTRPDLTYTGTYLNGRETYLELFPIGTFGYPLGVTGLGLGDEVTGGVQAVHDRWAAVFGADQVDAVSTISRELDGVTAPWFDQTAPVWGDLSTYTGLWTMQYVPDPGQTRPRTRHEERAARYQPSKLVENVQAVIYGLPDDDRHDERTTLAAIGWTVLPLPGDSFVAISPLDTGTRRAIYAVPAVGDRIGLLAVIWKLGHATAPHTELVGDATLVVAPHGAPYAALWFVAPSAADEARAVAAGR